jgi:hypothetical protein
MPARRPNPAVNTDARRQGFARAAVAGYITRWAPCGLGRYFPLNQERCCEERILHLRCGEVHGLVRIETA